MNIGKVLKAKKCGDIFSNDTDKIKEEYRKLIKEYHPDVNRDSTAREAFQIIQKLYAEAQEYIAQGKWQSSNTIILKEKNSTKRRTINFLININNLLKNKFK